MHQGDVTIFQLPESGRGRKTSWQLSEQTLSLVSLFCSLLQAAAGGSEGSEGGAEDEGGDEESSDSGESEGGDDDEDEDDGNKEEEENEEEEEENEPLSLAWPETRRKQATYLFLLPIVFPLWLTLPDVRNLVSTNRPHEHQWWNTKYIYSSTNLRYFEYFHVMQLYTSTPPHLSDKYCTFYSTTFVWQL